VLLIIETGLAVGALVVAFLNPFFANSWFSRIESRFAAFAQKKRLAVLSVALLAVVLRAAALPVLSVPKPQVNDEFGYVLAADTFAHGRLTNPTPAMWQHLETFSEIMRPTYQCFAQPGQGLFLAAGQVLTGRRFVGVVLSVALMCAAICWMLQGWLSPGWALLGGILVVLRLGVFTYWADSYWGGAVSALGGALVLGALPRIREYLRARHAIVMGIGLAILANSRPYEGLVFSIPVAIVLFVWLFRKRGHDLWLAVRQCVLPLAVVLAVAGSATAYYCWRVTGSAFTLPYQVDRETRGLAPYFIWQSPQPPRDYTIPALHDMFVNYELKGYLGMRTPTGMLGEWVSRFAIDWHFYLGPVLTLPFLVAALAVPYGFKWSQLDPRVRFLILASGVFLIGLGVEVFSWPHYAAPATCIVPALMLFALRFVRGWTRSGKPVGIFLSRAVPALCVAMLALRAAAVPLHISLAPSFEPTLYDEHHSDVPSYTVERQLDAIPGKHLVIVHYIPGSGRWMGWVRNAADIDASKIVWAWDLGAEKNRELVDYYSTRSAWIVYADETYPTINNYDGR
jgi:hypothetical protein